MQILVLIGCILRAGNCPPLNINTIWSLSIKSYLKRCWTYLYSQSITRNQSIRPLIGDSELTVQMTDLSFPASAASSFSWSCWNCFWLDYTWRGIGSVLWWRHKQESDWLLHDIKSVQSYDGDISTNLIITNLLNDMKLHGSVLTCSQVAECLLPFRFARLRPHCVANNNITIYKTIQMHYAVSDVVLQQEAHV